MVTQALPSHAVTIPFARWVYFGCHNFCTSLKVYPSNPHQDFQLTEEGKSFGEPDLRSANAQILDFAKYRRAGVWNPCVHGATPDREFCRDAELLAGITSEPAGRDGGAGKGVAY